ncbi:putative transposase [Gordonia rhizosphera NBRC 16068]|uniref:Putative transposase n=2 Tax=Gordonia rhizosphera TaxID=83341 RepID=K6WFI0_9ACTN|nr:putative transposase [Gordonia rhizosphera NBRC 16068]
MEPIQISEKRFTKSEVGYVLAVLRDTVVATDDGSMRVDELADILTADAWQTMSAGTGAKEGSRLFVGVAGHAWRARHRAVFGVDPP